MPFKIVQTIEDSKMCLSIVPSRWEENGILYWPNIKSRIMVHKLQKQEDSKPEMKWDKIPCIKKRELNTFEEAEKEVSHMEENSDTENTEVHDVSSKRKRVNAKPKPVLLNLNYLLTNETKNTEIEDDTSSCYQKPIIVHDHQLIPAPRHTETPSRHDGESDDYILVDPINQDETADQQVLARILENQEILLSQQAKIQVSIESLVNLLNKNLSKINVNRESNLNLIKNDFSPVNSEEKLKDLEEKLKDELFFNETVDKMSIICGKTGKENGFDVSYKLIDYFIEREFLKECSWTGNTREGGSTKKIPLKFFINFRKCFLKTVFLADSDFSEQKCDIFLKRILKNSVQRSTAKRILSTHKNRPKNIVYLRRNGVTKSKNCVVNKEDQLTESEVDIIEGGGSANINRIKKNIKSKNNAGLDMEDSGLMVNSGEHLKIAEAYETSGSSADEEDSNE